MVIFSLTDWQTSYQFELEVTDSDSWLVRDGAPTKKEMKGGSSEHPS